MYASICGTAVVQLKDIPKRPREYDGRITVSMIPSSSSDDVHADLSRFGEVLDIKIEGNQAAHVRFASHEQAARCVAELKTEKRRASCVYNETGYDRKCAIGESFSGWCTVEQGLASMVVAHLSEATQTAESWARDLPLHFKEAQLSRAKLTDISAGKARAVLISEEPRELLKRTSEDLLDANFVGKGDKERVANMLDWFEWIMARSMRRALIDYKEDDVTPDPSALLHSSAKTWLQFFYLAGGRKATRARPIDLSNTELLGETGMELGASARSCPLSTPPARSANPRDDESEEQCV